MSKINVNKNNQEKILCPYCSKEIVELIEKSVSGGMITSKSVYACGKCKKVVPVSHSTYAF